MSLQQPRQPRRHPTAPLTRGVVDAAHDASYVSGHDAIADGTHLQPGQTFAQSWRLRNTGSQAWGPGYMLACVGGVRLGAAASVPIPACPVGESVAIAVGFVAPQEVGQYLSIWQLATPDGQLFGDQVWIEIVVAAQPSADSGSIVGNGQGRDLAPPVEQRLAVPQTPGAAQTMAKIWNQYGALIGQEADRVGIHAAVALAVLAAESKGDPFDTNGRLILRFENHIFYTYWGQAHEELFRQHFTFATHENWQEHQWRPDAAGTWQDVHTSQESEWRVFQFARALDEKAALYASSMGAPQIMGFNHTAIGYATVQAMFDAFRTDVQAQLSSLFRFMEVNGLVEAVRHNDFLTFAKIYNGGGQAQRYQQIIQQHLDAYQDLLTTSGSAVRGNSPTPRLPQLLPTTLPDGRLLSEAEPELYAAWRKHIEHGFENNQTMFSRILVGFMNPYWLTVVMYALLFAVGLSAFTVAVILGLRATSAGAEQANATATILGSSAIFGGISVVAFLTYFLNRPLQALEENLQFITWLGVIYNTYWTRLAYIHKLETVQSEIEIATNDAIAKLIELMNKHTERSEKRPTLPLLGNLFKSDKP